MKTLSFFLPFVFLLSCCSSDPAQEKIVTVKTPQDVNKTVTEQIKFLFEKKANDSLLVIHKDSLVTFKFIPQIATADFTPYWTNSGKLSAIGDTLYKIIGNARHYALYKEDYHFSLIDSLVKNFYSKEKDEYNATGIAQTEMLLYDACLKFGAHLNKGRFYPDSLLKEWKPSKIKVNWVEIIKNGLKENKLRAAYESLEPKQEGYVFLRDEFRKYIYDPDGKEFDSIPTSLPEKSAEFKEKLIARLKASGEYDSTLSGSDSVKLLKAVKRFQKNWNMEPDGKLGKLTRYAFAYNRERIIRQMEMALERWRWEEEKMPKIYFAVNIPSFVLRVWEEDTLVIQSNIVCGKPETQTPLLKSKINQIIIYPYWNVPFSIAWKEILPAVQRDTSYLRKKDMEVLNGKNEVVDPATVKWKKYNKENLPFKFRQRIGDDNSLGIMKFNFNNKHGVYLHDTNSKRYFRTAARSQSHGCIRLDKYMEVARFLIRDDTLDIPIDSLDAWTKVPVQRKLDLKKRVPIYTKYFTAAADTANHLQIYLDIYRKDERMAEMIYGRRRKED